MLLSEVKRQIRGFSNKVLLTIVIIGGGWSIVFNIFFINMDYSKDILIGTQQYSLLFIGVFFSIFYSLIVKKKFGFFNYFVFSVNYRNKITLFFLLVFIISISSVSLFSILFDLPESYNMVRSGITKGERYANLMFSFSFFGVWYLSFAICLLVYFITEGAVLSFSILCYLFNRNYRKRYKLELSKIIKEVDNV